MRLRRDALSQAFEKAQKGKDADYPAADAERYNACQDDRSVVTGLECKDCEHLIEHYAGHSAVVIARISVFARRPP